MLLIEPIILAVFLEPGTPSWWDYPGLEAWKFFNLLVFAAGLMYFLKRPLTDAFRSRREALRRDLLAAQEGEQDARAKLAEVESLLAGLDSEVARIQEAARIEADGERQRIARDVELEIIKLREQSQREIAGAGKVARHDLRLFAAHQSVKLAEEIIRREIRPDDEVRLVNMNVERLGGS